MHARRLALTLVLLLAAIAAAHLPTHHHEAVLNAARGHNKRPGRYPPGSLRNRREAPAY